MGLSALKVILTKELGHQFMVASFENGLVCLISPSDDTTLPV